MAVEKVMIRNLQEFIKEVLGNQDVSSLLDQTYLYRGQAKSSWDLLPKIGRKKLDSGFPEDEEEIIDEFKRLGRPFIDHFVNNNDWDLLALAQHHGLETRLLDWSGNPLVALWFAFEEKQADDSSRAVWVIMLDKNELANTHVGTPLDQPKTKAFKPNHITKRITAQNGWFTAHRFMKETNAFIKLNTNKDYKNKITKFEIPNSARMDILEGLDALGVNHFSLFPDLVGLSKYLDWRSNK